MRNGYAYFHFHLHTRVKGECPWKEEDNRVSSNVGLTLAHNRLDPELRDSLISIAGDTQHVIASRSQNHLPQNLKT